MLYASATTQNFTYDLNGNRTSATLNTVGRTYNNAPSSNRLNSITNPVITYTYTATGNLQTDGINTFTYDARNRLVKVTNAAGTIIYTINALGQRMTKEVKNTAGTTTEYTAFAYDKSNHLISEFDLKNNRPATDYVWLYDVPVALLRYNPATGTTKWFAIHTDHLGTPRRITDPVNNHVTVWQYDSVPFGETLPNTNPSGLGIFEFNLRFAGQYFDKETGLHYNGARNYHAGLGRYIEADPVGLKGGSFSTYGYVGGNPVMRVDPDGKFFFVFCNCMMLYGFFLFSKRRW